MEQVQQEAANVWTSGAKGAKRLRRKARNMMQRDLIERLTDKLRFTGVRPTQITAMAKQIARNAGSHARREYRKAA